MRLNKLSIAFMCTIVLAGCATENADLDTSIKETELSYQEYIDITKQYNVNEKWWTLHKDERLNNLVELGFINNKDLAKAAINVNKALYQANLLGANLVPTFSGSATSSVNKNLDTGRSNISHGGSINVSYTVDLWRRLADSADAAEWTHKATEQDLEATRLSLANSIVDTYYQLAYLNDAIAITQETIKYYSQINSVMQNKLKLGAADSASTDQAQQAVLAAQNNLIQFQSQKKTAEQTLRNLLNLKPDAALPNKYPKILSVKNIGVDLNVPVSAIANRPDIKGNEYRLRSAFKDAKAMQKSWYPSVTLGASLSSSGTSVAKALDVPFAGGSVAVNLPFLDWERVKWNVKLSEANYETAKTSFEQSITTALNEIDANYYGYNQARKNYSNLQEKLNYDKRISQYYKNRYDAGIAELKDWLSAVNTEKASQLSILNAKYNVLQKENAIYSSMAGYHTNK